MCRKGQYECTGKVSMSVQARSVGVYRKCQYECRGKVSMNVEERSV